MKNSEFVATLMANTGRTRNVRTYIKDWIASGCYLVPDKMSTRIGCVVSLLQAKIDEGLIFDKEQEFLLIYNFQLSASNETTKFYTLCTVAKPLTQIKDLADTVGRPIQFMINPDTGDVVNNVQAMLILKVLNEKELEEENRAAEHPEYPICYGNYKNYHPLSCFLAIASYKPIDAMDIFAGKYNKSDVIHRGVAFDSITEARQYLQTKNELGLYILELPCDKDNVIILKDKGVSTEASKVIDYHSEKIVITPHPEAQQKIVSLVAQAKKLAPTMSAVIPSATASASAAKADAAYTAAAPK